MLREIELGVPRREALGALRERTDVPELSCFVVSLVQADEVGISVGEVLKAQAAQVRLKRRQRAREQAAKTPVKILVPADPRHLPGHLRRRDRAGRAHDRRGHRRPLTGSSGWVE